MTGQVETLATPVVSGALARRHVLSRGWGLYLLLAVALVPIVPEVKSQIVYSDPLNAAAVMVFMAAALVYRIPVRIYFALPVLMILVGSLIACMNASSPAVSLLCIVKDAYLYLWFLALVALMIPRGDLKGVRLAWLWVATLISLIVVVQYVGGGHFSLGNLFNHERDRMTGTFYNPNMFADYLMLSVFVVLGLAAQVRWRLLVPSAMLVGLALLTTKSNGGLISLCAGLLAWGLAWASARAVSTVRLAGVLVLGLAIVLLAVWLPGELGVEIGLARLGGAHGLASAVTRSHESRDRIWRRLESNWMKTPMGIGPEGSAGQALSVGEADGPGLFVSKEAHDDYLAYLVERGPFGIVGLLLCMVQVFAMVLGSRQRLSRLLGGSRAGAALWAAFIGALVGTSVHSLVCEKLHFRHFWLFMAILTAMTATDSASEPAAAEKATAARSPRYSGEPAGAAGVVPTLRA